MKTNLALGDKNDLILREDPDLKYCNYSFR
jgi:hypothetical protein